MAESIFYTIFAIFAVYGIYTAAREVVAFVKKLIDKDDVDCDCHGCSGCCCLNEKDCECPSAEITEDIKTADSEYTENEDDDDSDNMDSFFRT